MDLDTRRLTSADWPQLWPFLLEMGTTGDEIDVRDRFAALIADPRWLLLGAASPASTLLGYAAAQDHGPHLRHGDLHRTARLHDLFVSRDARRQGVGRALMSTVAEWRRRERGTNSYGRYSLSRRLWTQERGHAVAVRVPARATAS